MREDVAKIYGQRLRARVCGICWHGDDLLMVNHDGIGPGNFWAPPGGGIDFGVSATDVLIREFLEETGLSIEVGDFLFACEHVKEPVHAIELFFNVSSFDGTVRIGDDPEIQIIKDVRFMPFEVIKQLPSTEVHGIFQYAQSAAMLRGKTGFYSV